MGREDEGKEGELDCPSSSEERRIAQVTPFAHIALQCDAPLIVLVGWPTPPSSSRLCQLEASQPSLLAQLIMSRAPLYLSAHATRPSPVTLRCRGNERTVLDLLDALFRLVPPCRPPHSRRTICCPASDVTSGSTKEGRRSTGWSHVCRERGKETQRVRDEYARRMTRTLQAPEARRAACVQYYAWTKTDKRRQQFLLQSRARLPCVSREPCWTRSVRRAVHVCAQDWVSSNPGRSEGLTAQHSPQGGKGGMATREESLRRAAHASCFSSILIQQPLL